MSRAVALTAILGLFVAGLGCKHVAGRNDCYYNPEDNHLPQPSNPYYPIGAPITGPITAAEPKVVEEPKKDEKKDEPKKDEK
jgi:hypothetical protein